MNNESIISVTILTKNNSKYLREVLDSTIAFGEVLIYDNGSTDDTLEIASSYPNVTIYKGLFKGFGRTHNVASELAKNDWILSIDSDEVVSRDLVIELQKLSLNPKTVYSIPRKNYYNGKFIKWCGWYPDRVYRLYNKKETTFTNADVHEQVIVAGLQHIPLKSAIKHYSYTCLSDFINKMQLYSDLFAEQNFGKKSSSPCKATLHGLYAFIKSYFFQRGFLGGYEAFTISTYNAFTAFYKYMKLYEKIQQNNKK